MSPKFVAVTGLLLLLLTANLSACGNNQLPLLGQPGQPTLVFIYTDN
jgi:hypothetical protein